MKAKELIKLLQILDPECEINVFPENKYGIVNAKFDLVKFTPDLNDKTPITQVKKIILG